MNRKGIVYSNVTKLSEVSDNYVPYIVDIGNGLYQVNGDHTFSYVTNKQGAEEAHKALVKLVEEYGK